MYIEPKTRSNKAQVETDQIGSDSPWTDNPLTGVCMASDNTRLSIL